MFKIIVMSDDISDFTMGTTDINNVVSHISKLLKDNSLNYEFNATTNEYHVIDGEGYEVASFMYV